jgi:hypothetical protein
MKRLFLGVVLLAVSAGLTQTAGAGHRPPFPRDELRPAKHAAAPAEEDNATRVTHVVKPSEADPSITRFDEANIAMFEKSSSDHAPLVVFMPGTNGAPANAPLLLRTIAGQGYRVIGLE